MFCLCSKQIQYEFFFSNAGDVRFWDPRFTESVRTLNLQQGLTAVDIHKHADVLAWYVILHRSQVVNWFKQTIKAFFFINLIFIEIH